MNKYLYVIRRFKIKPWIKYYLLKEIKSALPEEYQELEYLEANGNQKIKIPYRVNNKTKLYARYMQTSVGTSSASVAFGVTSAPATNNANNGIARILPGRTLGTVNRVAWGGNIIGSTVDIGTAFFDLETWYEIYFNLNKIYINNTLVATSTQDPSVEWKADYDFGIFIRGGSADSLPFTGRISKFYCTENGRKTVNLIPALRISDKKPGMYDTVTDTFFVNQGTGEFSYKVKLPKQYKLLEYIESSGSQYIDTLINGEANWIAKFQGVNTTRSTSVCLVTNADGGDAKSGKWLGYNSSGKWGTSGNNFTDINYNEQVDINAEFKRTGVTVTINDVELAYSYTLNFTNETWKLLSGSTSYPSSVRCYGAVCYQGNVLVANLIPALRLSDKKPGMYDTVTDTFFVNQGSGEFSYRGENIFNASEFAFYKTGVILTDGGTEAGSTSSGYTLPFIDVEPNTEYILSGEFTQYSGEATSVAGAYRVYYYDENDNFLGRSANLRPSRADSPSSFTTPASCTKLAIQCQYLQDYPILEGAELYII